MGTVGDQVQDERTARIVLSLIADPDDALTGRVLSQVGGVEVLRLLDMETSIPALDENEAKVWRSRLAPRLDIGVLATADSYRQLGMNTLIASDDHWPTALVDLGPRQPYVLWTKGATSFLSGALSDRVTITGSRASTQYGNRVASDLTIGLADEDRTIVTGGGYGIEGASLRETLATGAQGIVVLATGIERRYPSGNARMLDTLGDVGLLISESPPDAVPTKRAFLARHRVLAALSGASVVVEAGFRSGARNIAKEAVALDRKVGAVPGPITSAASSGTNEILRDGTASVVTQTSDVLHLLDNSPSNTSPPDMALEAQRMQRRVAHPAPAL